MTAPRITIDLDKIEYNSRVLVERLAPKGISVTGITKGVLGNPDVAAAMRRGGVCAFGDSRVENIERLRASGLADPVSLIRSPMLSQADDVVHVADTSFNSERRVIEQLSSAAVDQGRSHGVLLMVELGDLREGVLADELIALARATVELPALRLVGLGTNLACQSGVAPDATNMAELSRLVDLIESTLDVGLATVSGGNSANLGWALDVEDTGRVNTLRLGESILLGRDPLRGTEIEGLHSDAITLTAEVIESKTKPRQPWGDVRLGAFGAVEPRRGSGHLRQSLLAIGRQDTDPSGLNPPDGTEIIGSSSDHMVVDGTDSGLEVGDEVEFGVNYGALLAAMTSPFVSTVLTRSGNTA